MRAAAVEPARQWVGVEERAAPVLASPRVGVPGLEALITGRYPMSWFCERATNGGIKHVIAVGGSE